MFTKICVIAPGAENKISFRTYEKTFEEQRIIKKTEFVPVDNVLQKLSEINQNTFVFGTYSKENMKISDVLSKIKTKPETFSSRHKPSDEVSYENLHILEVLIKLREEKYDEWFTGGLETTSQHGFSVTNAINFLMKNDQQYIVSLFKLIQDESLAKCIRTYQLELISEQATGFARYLKAVFFNVLRLHQTDENLVAFFKTVRNMRVSTTYGQKLYALIAQHNGESEGKINSELVKIFDVKLHNTFLKIDYYFQRRVRLVGQVQGGMLSSVNFAELSDFGNDCIKYELMQATNVQSIKNNIKIQRGASGIFPVLYEKFKLLCVEEPAEKIKTFVKSLPNECRKGVRLILTCFILEEMKGGKRFSDYEKSLLALGASSDTKNECNKSVRTVENDSNNDNVLLNVENKLSEQCKLAYDELTRALHASMSMGRVDFGNEVDSSDNTLGLEVCDRFQKAYIVNHLAKCFTQSSEGSKHIENVLSSDSCAEFANMAVRLEWDYALLILVYMGAKMSDKDLMDGLNKTTQAIIGNLYEKQQQCASISRGWQDGVFSVNTNNTVGSILPKKVEDAVKAFLCVLNDKNSTDQQIEEQFGKLQGSVNDSDLLTQENLIAGFTL